MSEPRTVPQFKPSLDIDDVLAGVREVLESGYIAEGPRSATFRDALLDLIGVKHGFFAPNGTLAISLALMGAGIGPGDEVLVPDLTFIATANAVKMVGADPRPVDIVSATNPTLDVEAIELSDRTRAVMIAPLFGTAPTNLEQIIEFCEANDLMLIEDAAQCIGIQGPGGHMGSFGHISTFSFYADKTITMGEGGLVVTDDDEVAARTLLLRNQGRPNSGTFLHEAIGYNFRITDMQAALGLSQLANLDSIAAAKQALDAGYHERLDGVEGVEFLVVRDDFTHIPFRVVVFVDDAEPVLELMTQAGVQSRAMFHPIHRQPGYADQPWSSAAFPHSDECGRRGICLPTWIGMTDTDLDQVADAVTTAVQSLRG